MEEGDSMIEEADIRALDMIDYSSDIVVDFVLHDPQGTPTRTGHPQIGSAAPATPSTPAQRSTTVAPQTPSACRTTSGAQTATVVQTAPAMRTNQAAPTNPAALAKQGCPPKKRRVTSK